MEKKYSVKKKKKILIMIGPPGAGKGSVSQYIKENYCNFNHVALGSKLRFYAQLNNDFGKNIKKIIDGGNLLGISLIDVMVREIFDEFKNLSIDQNVLILDGFPRTKEQVKLFFQIYEKYKDSFTYNLISISLKKETLKKRLLNRFICSKCDKIYSLFSFSSKNIICKKCVIPLSKREDDSIDVIEKRLKIYFDEEKRIFSYLDNQNISYCTYDFENKGISDLGIKITQDLGC